LASTDQATESRALYFTFRVAGGSNETPFEFLRPRSGKSEAMKRERELARKIERLMEIRDEATFKAGLERDLE
jgi:hypothetical protein